ncbi:HFR123Cp [Eremothecium sinecaudum]|uniref:HFR123Cp n=1 Tax=Eremothecium sinecaudum TaxID=45286 RepID=A0A109V088_9SACH|nr:HFR123Cp [Eremothecium sinecaudum]AMD21978.1 HFR123Cp [Eremothecium sinecaudum]
MSNKAEQFNKVVSKIDRLEAYVEQIVSMLNTGGSGGRGRKRRTRSHDGDEFSKRLNKGEAASCSSTTGEKEEGCSVEWSASEMSGSASRDGLHDESLVALDESDQPVRWNRGFVNGIGLMSSYSVVFPRGLEWVHERSANSEADIERISQWQAHISSRNQVVTAKPSVEQNLSSSTVMGYMLEIYKRFTPSEVLPVHIRDVDVDALYKKLSDDAASMKSSELMIVNIISALVCLFLRLGTISMETVSDLLMELPPHLIQKYEEEFVGTSLSLAYRVALASEGMISIKAIVHLIIYTGLSGAIYASYSLISVAVRLSQDLGLHSESTYTTLSEADLEERRGVWWMCRAIDLRFSVILGKPPVVATFDTTTKLPEKDKTFELLERVSIKSAGHSKEYDPEFAEDLYDTILKSKGFLSIAGHYHVKLCTLTSRVYAGLYDCSTECNPKRQYRRIKSIQRDLEEHQLSLPKCWRDGRLFQSSNMTGSTTEAQGVLVMENTILHLLDTLLVQRCRFKVEKYLKATSKLSHEPEYKGVQSSRRILEFTIALAQNYLNVVIRVNAWAFFVVCIDIFCFSLALQKDEFQFEGDMNLLLNFLNRVHTSLTTPTPFTAHETNTFPMEMTTGDNFTNLLNNFLFLFARLVSIMKNTLEARTSKKLQLNYEFILQKYKEPPIQLPNSNFVNAFDFLNPGFEDCEALFEYF